MKKIIYLFALLAACTFAFTGCSKDDEDPSFKKEQFLGKWEVVDSEEDCPETYEFKSDDTYLYGTSCSTSTNTMDYSFDGKRTITLTDMLGATLTIKDLSATTMNVEVSALGFKSPMKLVKK